MQTSNDRDLTDLLLELSRQEHEETKLLNDEIRRIKLRMHQIQRVMRCLDVLPPAERKLLVDRFVDHKSFKTLLIESGVSNAAFAKRIKGALQDVCELYEMPVSDAEIMAIEYENQSKTVQKTRTDSKFHQMTLEEVLANNNTSVSESK